MRSSPDTDLKNTGLTSPIESGRIISGAIDGDSKRGKAHAARYYEEVRKMKTDVAAIAKNTGYTKEAIQEVKNHLFYDKHHLGDGRYDVFDQTYDQAVSWQRLIEGKNI